MKRSHKGCCLDTLYNLMKDFLGGSYLDISSNPRIPVDRQLMAIGYK